MIRIFFLTAVSYLYGISNWKNSFLQGATRYFFLFIIMNFLLEILKLLKIAYIRIQKSRLYEIKVNILKKHDRQLNKELDKQLYHMLKGKFHQSKLFNIFFRVNSSFTKFPWSILKVI
jgi:hypothetical protein